MDEYEKLDFLLAEYKRRLSYNISDDEWNEIAQKLVAANINHTAYKVLVERLRSDEMIIKTDDGVEAASHKAIVFKGYKQTYIDDINERQYRSNYDARMENNARSLKIGTWFLVAATACLALVVNSCDVDPCFLHVDPPWEAGNNCKSLMMHKNTWCY